MLIFLQQLINGLTTGTLFALIAIGYTMVYGIIELINFAHGDLFMLGSFLALTLGLLGLENAGTAGVTAGGVLPSCHHDLLRGLNFSRTASSTGRSATPPS